MFEEVLLPNGKEATSKQDIDEYLASSGLALAGDFSNEYYQNVRRRNKKLQAKEAFDDFINEYKKRIWNE